MYGIPLCLREAEEQRYIVRKLLADFFALRKSKYMLSARDINFVKPAEGHDDFLISLALLVEAAKYAPRGAKGKLGDY
jgi:hypothetical protein